MLFTFEFHGYWWFQLSLQIILILFFLMIRLSKRKGIKWNLTRDRLLVVQIYFLRLSVSQSVMLKINSDWAPPLPNQNWYTGWPLVNYANGVDLNGNLNIYKSLNILVGLNRLNLSGMLVYSSWVWWFWIFFNISNCKTNNFP